MYIKVIGSIFLLGSAAAIGFLKSEELKERVKKLLELKRMMVLLQGELRFHRATLSEAFENVSARVEDPFRAFLEGTAQKLDVRDGRGFEQVWEENAGELLKSEGFLEEDGRFLELLKNGLGYLDLTMQTETLDLAMAQVEEAIQIAGEQQQIKGKLYRTMGVTVGALLTLLMI